MSKKKVIKSVVIISVFVTAFFLYRSMSSQIPIGHSPFLADSMAIAVMEGLGRSAWDSSSYVSWTFGSEHHYEWYKSKDSVIVTWKRNRVIINLDAQKGQAIRKGKVLRGDENFKYVKKAIDYFNNDSFWLCAHFKMMDIGTSREIIDFAGGAQGLKVTYASGGSTPGDTYVWVFDDDKPSEWKMWVSILPFGGVKTTWEEWTEISGVWIALNHKLAFLNIRINDLVIH